MGAFILKSQTGKQLLEYICCYLSLNCGKVVLDEKHRPENRPNECWASLIPSLLFACQTVKLLHRRKQFASWSAIRCWICLSAAVKVGKVRSENGEASWVRVGWGGWLWQTWESCPAAANKLVSTLTLIHQNWWACSGDSVLLSTFCCTSSDPWDFLMTVFVFCVGPGRIITVPCVLLRKTRGWRESGLITLPTKHSDYLTLTHAVVQF